MRRHRTGWTILAVLAVLGVGSALFLALPAQPTEGDLQPVGLTWVEIQGSNPALAELISSIYRLAGIAHGGFSLFLLAIAIHGWRTRERWAWRVAWLQPATYATYGVAFVASGNTGIAFFYLALAVIGAGALVLARAGLSKDTEDARDPA